MIRRWCILAFVPPLLVLTPLLLASCSDSYATNLAAPEDGGAGDDDAADGYLGDDDDPTDDEEPPPEEEDDFISVAPSAADVVVFIVNPNRDTVSEVHVQTRQIATIEVGDEPSQVAVTADYTRAVVFNDGDDSVSVIDVGSGDVASVDVRENFNTMAMSPTGRHAVCYLDTDLLEGNEPLDGVLSFTEISVVDLDGLVSHDFSVGFNPRQVKFADDGDLAVIISDELITVVDLTAETPLPRLIDLGADPFDPPVAAEVEVEPTGRYAFVRYENADLIQVVDLASGADDWLSVGIDPSDMDLSPGDGAELMVVSRGSQELWIFDATDPLATPDHLDLPATETIGSLTMAPVGDMALLYTTAVLTDRVTVWDRSEAVFSLDEDHVERLVKPVKQVIMAPDGESLAVVHTLQDAEGEDDIYTDHHALTIASVTGGTFMPNAVQLEDELASLANFGDGRYALFMMADNRFVGVVDYETRLVDDLQVPSYPVHVGVMPEDSGLPAPVGWISQDHPLGRISFVDPETLELQTVTGFELNSGIE